MHEKHLRINSRLIRKLFAREKFLPVIKHEQLINEVIP